MIWWQQYQRLNLRYCRHQIVFHGSSNKNQNWECKQIQEVFSKRYCGWFNTKMTAKHVETLLFTKPRCRKNLIVLSVKWYVWECGQMMVVAWIDVGLLQEAGVTTDPCIDLCSTSHQSDWLASIQKIGREKGTSDFAMLKLKRFFHSQKFEMGQPHQIRLKLS